MTRTSMHPARPRATRLRRPAIAIGVILACGAVAGPATAAEKLDPHRFDVQLEFEPTVVDEDRTCSAAATALRICTHEMVMRERGRLVTGTVRELPEGSQPRPDRGGPDEPGRDGRAPGPREEGPPPEGVHGEDPHGAEPHARPAQGLLVPRDAGATGTMTMTLDMDQSQRMKIRVPADGPPSLLAIRGDGGQAATWQMRFSGGHTLTGTMVAKTRVRKGATPNTFTMTMDHSVEVVAGTGRFSGVTGRGRFTDVITQQIPFEGTGGGPPDGPHPEGPEGGDDGRGEEPRHDPHRPPAPEALGPAAAGGKKDGSMRLKLRRGRNGLSIVVARRDLRAGSRVPLVVAAKPGTRVRAFASQGRSRVRLGAAVTDKRGRATFKGALRAKLSRLGAWKIRAQAGTGRRAARDTVVVVAKR